MESYSQSLSVYRQEGETLVPLYVFIVEQARRKLDLMKGMKKTMKRKMSVACCVLLLIASAMNMLGVMALAAPSFQRPIDVDGGSWVDAYRYYMDNMSPYKGYAVLADFDLDGKPELLALEGEWSHAGAAGCFVKYTGSQYIVYKDSSLFVWDDQLHLVLDNGSYVWYKSSSYASTGYYGSYVSRLSFSGNMKLSESKWFEMHGDMDEGTEAYQIGSRGVSWNEYNQEEAKWNRMNKLLTLDPASFSYPSGWNNAANLYSVIARNSGNQQIPRENAQQPGGKYDNTTQPPAGQSGNGAKVSSANNGSMLASEMDNITLCNYSATSELTDQYGAYRVSNCFDRNTNTTWAEAASGDGIGSMISGGWSVQSGSWQLTGVVIWAGYHKSSDVFYKNNRPHMVTLEVESDGAFQSFDVSLMDSQSCQYILFDRPLSLSSDARIWLTINSVYSGNKYTDTCISDMDLLVQRG